MKVSTAGITSGLNLFVIFDFLFFWPYSLDDTHPPSLSFQSKISLSLYVRAFLAKAIGEVLISRSSPHTWVTLTKFNNTSLFYEQVCFSPRTEAISQYIYLIVTHGSTMGEATSIQSVANSSTQTSPPSTSSYQ